MSGMSGAIRRGRVTRPMRILIHGGMKVGKTSFASASEEPIFLSMDDGSDNFDVARLPTPSSFDDVLEGVRRAHRDKLGKTLVVDPLNYIEPLIYESLCKTN